MYMYTVHVLMLQNEREREGEETLSRCGQSVVNKLISRCLHNGTGTVGLGTVTIVLIKMTSVLMVTSQQQGGNLKRRE